MKTTVNIPDELMQAVKRAALERGTTVTELVREGLRTVLDERRELPELPTVELGEPAIDLADREQLWDAVYG